MTHHLHTLIALLGLIPLAVALGGCAAHKQGAPALADRGFIFGEHPAGAETINYAVYVPRNYDALKPAPCILFLHGKGESGTDGNKQIIQGLGSALLWNAAEWPCIVVLPQKPDADRQWEDDAPAVMEILARIKERWSIDYERVYLTGLSQGGHGTWALASMYPGTFAAIAPICGYARPMTPEHVATAVGNVPVWAFHGLADDVVPPTGTTAITDALRRERAGKPGAAELKVSLFEGVNHGSWDRAYRESGLAPWLLAQRRARAGAGTPR